MTIDNSQPVGAAEPPDDLGPPAELAVDFLLVEEAVPQRVVIKTVEGTLQTYRDRLEEQLGESFLYHWEALLVYGLTISRAFRTIEGPEGREDLLPELLTYYEVLLPPADALSIGREVTAALADFMEEVNGVIELVYIESPPAPLPASCGGRARAYLGDAPRGMGIGAALGADNDQWPCVTVLEYVWQHGHPDLDHVTIIAGAEGPQPVYADDPNYRHATASLGILAASGSAGGPGCPGMLPPAAEVKFASVWVDDPPYYRWLQAIASQIVAVTDPEHGHMSRGDILLVEVQIWGRNLNDCDTTTTLNEANAVLAPLELEPLLCAALRQASRWDICVIEPAGNGSSADGVELDSLATWLDCLSMPNGAAAILTAACDGVRTNGVHQRLPQSNFGPGVVCHGWGDFVVALDSTNHSGTWAFGGTSAASALVAGAAAWVQHEAMISQVGRRLKPDEMATALSFSSTVPPSGAGLNIGVMPNLNDIVTNLLPTL